MLHVTNGDIAVRRIRDTGALGDIVPWNDALHEGPVPAELPPEELRRIRAAFIAAQGWDDESAALAMLEERDATLDAVDQSDEVVLWFEHDLYDQLQLLEVLARLSACPEPPATSLAQSDRYLGTLDLAEMRALYAARREITSDQLEAARKIWDAFRAPDPHALLALSRKRLPFPFVGDALQRHLEQFPSVEDGLTRSEQQILLAAAAEPITLERAFERHNAAETAVFLGDMVFASYVERLMAEPSPLLQLLSRGPLGRPRDSTHAVYWDRFVTLTDSGRAILAGGRDWLAEQGIDRWYGGVHLTGSQLAWRWSRQRGTIVRSDV